MPSASPTTPPPRRSFGLLMLRYGLGVVLVLAGVVVLFINPGGFGVDGFAMAAGSGFSVLMLNWLYRLGVRSDQERIDEEEARIFLAKHGHWPDEVPRPAPRRGRGPA